MKDKNGKTIDVSQAIAHVRSLDKSLRGVFMIADVLEHVDGLERAIETAERQIGEAQERRDRENKITDEAQNHREAAEGLVCQAEDDLKTAEKEAKDVVFLAEQEAREIIVSAEKQAMEVGKTAQKEQKMTDSRNVIDRERHAAEMKKFAEAEKVARAKMEEIEEKLAVVRGQIGLPSEGQ